MKILIIDDDKSSRWVVSAELKKHGFETIEAENGAEGLKAARDLRPDLIISDYAMEKTDGYEILLALRMDPATSKIPFILMTGSPERAGLKTGSGRPPENILLKPFQPAELMRIVEAHLPKPGPGPAADAMSGETTEALIQLEDSLLKLDDSLKKLRRILKKN